MQHISHLLLTFLAVLASSIISQAEIIDYEGVRYEASGDTAIYLYGTRLLPVYPYNKYYVYVDDAVINKDTGKSYTVTALAGRYNKYGYIECTRQGYSKFRIPNTVKYIGDGALGCDPHSYYPPITLDFKPDNLVMIGDKAFYGNLFNSWLYLPKVLSIGRSAFENCTEMQGVTLGNALHTVKEQAFAGCTFTVIDFGDAIETIGDRAFRSCIRLNAISFRSAPDTLGVSAFEGCGSLRHLEIGDPGKWSRTVFGNETANPIIYTNRFMVNGSIVRHLDIGTEGKGVSEWAFKGAGNLLTVRVTGGGRVGSEAFLSCAGVTDICLEVDSIKNRAFSDLVSLKRIYSMTAVPPATDNDIFSTYSGVTLYVPAGSGDAYRSHPVWCRFSKIEETDFTGIDALFKADYEVSGIDDIRTDVTGDADEEAPVRIYTLDGRHAGDKADRLRPGIYILRQGRKARKITVR